MIDYIEDTRHLQKLKANGFNPKLVVDIGASNGEFYNECQKIFTDAKYILFEARAKKETSIAETIRDITPKPTLHYNTFLGRTAGTNVTFFNMNAGSSVFSENTKFPREVETKKVHRLDSIVKLESMKSVSRFLKIDTQGYELEILRGIDFLAHRFEVVQLEVALLEYNAGAPTVAQVHEYMDGRGFALYDFGPAFSRQSDGAIFHMDWVFVAKRSKLRDKKIFWKAEERLNG